MPILSPLEPEVLVNTSTADGQISPKVLALAGGKYMVLWVGPVTLPVTIVNGSFAPSYANADIRAQIFNADGTKSGGEFVVNTTTAGGQLRPVVAQLSDGHVLVSWHDGVGPAGGQAETTPNTIRAQEYDGAGVAVGAEFVIGNSNGRLHSVAATAGGGFVVTYQQGGVGGVLAVGPIVAQVYDSSNVQTSSFVIDNSQPLGTTALVAVEADGDIVVAWPDRAPFGGIQGHVSRFDASGTELSSGYSIVNYTGVAALATGGSVLFGYVDLGNQNFQLFAEMVSVDGSLSRSVLVAQVTNLFILPTIAPLANGGFIASWSIDSDPGSGVNVEIMARAFNAIGNPIGAEFQVNSVTTSNQSSPSFAQLSDGDIVATWIDESQLNGDTSGTAIVARRIDYSSANQNPTASDITLRLGDDPNAPFDLDPTSFDEFFGPDGYDADGDPLVVSAVSNVSNGTVTVNPDGTLHVTVAPGATAPLAFDYTVSDGQGGTATARATLVFPNDYVTVRAGSTVLIDFLANDFYTPGPGATPFQLPQYIADGSAEQGRASFVSTPQGSRILFNPLAPNRGTLFELAGVQLNSSYFNLAVGDSLQVVPFSYSNNETNGTVLVTVQGWAQLGGTGADNLVGTADADHLSGGTDAANTMAGGSGDDWYTVRAAGDVVTENSGEGLDSVRTDLTTYILPANVENLYFMYLGDAFSSTVTIGTGNELANRIYFGGFGPGAELYGLGGDDILIGGSLLIGGAGADQLIGGAASYADSPGGVTIDLSTNVNTGSDAQGDTLFSVTRVIGSASADSITGSTAAETLEGGDGADFIFGGDGSDILLGDAGDDVIWGDAGSDTIDGGSGANDEARYAGNLAQYTIQRVDNNGDRYVSIVGTGLMAADGFDQLRNVEFVQFANQRITLANSPPVLSGTPLPDQSVGDGVFFSYQIPAGTFTDPNFFDVLQFSATALGSSQLPYWLGFDPATRTFSGTPGFIDAGTSFQIVVRVADLATGDPNSFVTDTFTLSVTLSPGQDVNGTSAPDELFGTTRAERMFGQDGNDIFYGSSGADQIDGGNGSDTVFYNAFPIGVTVNLATGLGGVGQAEGDTYVSIENVTGSTVDDILIGNAADNVFNGRGGNDDIDGGAGNHDTAVYEWNRLAYIIEKVSIGGVERIRVTGIAQGATDGVDLLTNIEFLKFADMTMSATNSHPVLGSPAIPDQNAGDGVLYTYQIPASAFTDPDPADVLTFTATLADGSPLPGWLGFNPATRTFSGTPLFADIGTVLQIRVRATDNAPGDPASVVIDDFALTVVLAPGADVNGTANPDTLNGTFRAERMFGLDSDDVLNGSDGADQIDGGNGNDTVSYAGSGGGVAVVLSSGQGSSGQAAGDTYVSIENVTGSTFGDLLIGDSGANVLGGGGGIDTLNGGAGNDRLVVSAAGSGTSVDGGADTDTLVVSGVLTFGTLSGLEAIELVGGASLTLSAAQFNTGFYNPIAQVGMATVSGSGSLVFNMDFNPVTSALYLTSLSFVPGSSVTLTINGTSGLDAIKGAPGVANIINGGDEADQIRGGSLADTINGGNGNDKLFGWSGADVLTGGAGSDQFRYFFATDSGTGAAADRITDFQIGTDKFNFVIIDADPVTPDDQAFAFLGTGAFTSPGTGQIRYQDSGANLLVQVDVDGNGTVDMEMVLQGLAGQTLTSGDFML